MHDRLDLHCHEEIVQPVSAPAAAPRGAPIAEAGAECHRSAKAKEFGFGLHWADRRSAHSLPRDGRESSPRAGYYAVGAAFHEVLGKGAGVG